MKKKTKQEKGAKGHADEKLTTIRDDKSKPAGAKSERHWPNNTTFMNGAIRQRDLVYVCICDDELLEQNIGHSVFVALHRDEWIQAGKTKWTTASMSVVTHPTEQMLAIDEYGKAWLCGGGDMHEELIADGKLSPRDRGTMRVARAIEGRAYAAGMDRQVYRRDGKHQWTCIDESMRPPEDDDDVVGFEGIDGFSAKDIYAGGWGGEIWQWNGKKWRQIDSPTNANITNLVCGDDDFVYACGRQKQWTRIV